MDIATNEIISTTPPSENIQEFEESKSQEIPSESLRNNNVEVERNKRGYISNDTGGQGNRKRMRTTGYFQEDVNGFQPAVLEDWLEVEEELEEAQRNLVQAREERKAAQREREQARRERLEAQKDRESAREERLKAQAERILARKERLKAKREREECRGRRQEAQRRRQTAREERLQREMELEEAQNEVKAGSTLLGEIHETQAELDEVKAEFDEAQRERQAMERDVREALTEQIDESLEHEEELLERAALSAVQNIKVEEYNVGISGDSSEDGEEEIIMRKFSSLRPVVALEIGLGSQELTLNTGGGGGGASVCDTVLDLEDQSLSQYKFRCPDCGNGYNKRSSFMRHAKTHSSAGNECHLCKKMFVRADVLRRHIKNMHGELVMEDSSLDIR